MVFLSWGAPCTHLSFFFLGHLGWVLDLVIGRMKDAFQDGSVSGYTRLCLDRRGGGNSGDVQCARKANPKIFEC